MPVLIALSCLIRRLSTSFVCVLGRGGSHCVPTFTNSENLEDIELNPGLDCREEQVADIVNIVTRIELGQCHMLSEIKKLQDTQASTNMANEVFKKNNVTVYLKRIRIQ